MTMHYAVLPAGATADALHVRNSPYLRAVDLNGGAMDPRTVYDIAVVLRDTRRCAGPPRLHYVVVPATDDDNDDAPTSIAARVILSLLLLALFTVLVGAFSILDELLKREWYRPEPEDEAADSGDDDVILTESDGPRITV